MSAKKDMRRHDLIVPFVEPEKDASSSGDMSGTISSTLPMAAIFLRNRMMAWVAVTFALQHWLSETPDQKRSAGTPAIFAVFMALMSVVVCYLPLFMPPPGQIGTGTNPAAPIPQA